MSDDGLAVVKAIDRLADEVRSLRTTIAFVMRSEPEAPAAVSATCAHPDESRVPMASAGNEDFFCRACDRLVEQPLAAARG